MLAAFSIFMSVVLLLIPSVMLLFGRIWKKRPPAEINDLYGYRTRRSMKNRQTWEFAHQVCAKIWSRLGRLALAVTVAAWIPVLIWCRTVCSVGLAGGVLVLLQMLALVTSIPATEHRLKQEFGN